MNHNYRGYFFGNYYLSSLQQGLQAAHVIQKMTNKYLCEEPNLSLYKNTPAKKMFKTWCKSDLTIILLNGGNCLELKNIVEVLDKATNGGMIYPMCTFREDEESLNGAITSVGIVLPESVYNMEKDENSPFLPKDKSTTLRELIINELIISKRLAS